MHPPNLGQQLRIADHPVTRRAGLGRVVGARGDRAAVLRQHPADRLDPELSTIDHVVTMLVDEPHERGDGRSSSAAKKADAVFKIAFARRSSRFSRFSAFSDLRDLLTRATGPGAAVASQPGGPTCAAFPANRSRWPAIERIAFELRRVLALRLDQESHSTLTHLQNGVLQRTSHGTSSSN